MAVTRNRPSLALALALPLGLLWIAVQDDDEPPREPPWDLAEPAPVVALRPERPTGVEALACAECHASVVEEWAGTSHAIAWVDEVYQDYLASRKKPELCHSCHVPEPLLAGGSLARPSARPADRHLGIACDACHLGPEGEQLGPRGRPTDAHPTGRSALLSGAGTNELCSSCHATNIGPVIGIAKDFASSKQAERGRSCVGCHMAPLGPPDEDGHVVRSHALQTPRDPTFLARAFAPRIETDGGKTRVVIENRAGHRVPGLIGREIRFTARLVGAGGEAVAEGELSLDARHYLPVDGSTAIELTGTGAKVVLAGDHVDPRAPGEPVRFLEVELSEGER